MNCVVFGAGAWGTAMAIHLDRQGHTVTLVPRRLEQALKLTAERENTDYLKGHKLSASLQIGLEAIPALMDADVVFLACPSKGLAELVSQIGPALRASSARMVVSRGDAERPEQRRRSRPRHAHRDGPRRPSR
jgi:glycerol-3-phosphate dehydrogenase (NAD(P)+)